MSVPRTAFGDETLDYALVDSAPRGCLCAGIAPKLRPGGVLILDNANWYLPPPASGTPACAGNRLGRDRHARQPHTAPPVLARVREALIADWPALWSSNGVQMTLVLVKP